LGCATDLLNESLRVLDETCAGPASTASIVSVPLPQPRSE
jgi:hypothetical protein